MILSNADYDYRHTLRSLLGKEIKEQDTKKEVNSHADTETEKRALFYRRLREFFSLVHRQLKELYDIWFSR